MEKYACLGCFLIVLLTIVINLGIFALFMFLWNNVIILFWTSAPILTYWQAAGCVIIIELIIGWLNRLIK